jgi:3-hydroxy-9,10-secoandrosta-1,3,5(10)-triene-9,17-dione monooxygenase
MRLVFVVMPISPSVRDATGRAAELLERARGLTPVLRTRAAYCEEIRTIPSPTIAELRAAELLRIATPTRFGGLGLDIELIADVAGEIARACGSTGWMASLWAVHQYVVGWWGAQAQAEFWADGPDTLASTASALVSFESERAEGGLRITGRWKFASGIDHAEWVILHTPNENCLVPRPELEIEDDWYVSGLRGTGSKSVVAKGVLVPQHRIVTHEELAMGSYPGRLVSDSPWHKLPNPMALVLPNFTVAPLAGMSQGVADVFEERVQGRLDPQTQQPAHERSATQLRFAEATAELHAARLVLDRNLADLRATGEAGGQLTLEERTLSRRNLTYAATLCTRATNRLVDGTDSTALYEVTSLHRLARDVRAGALQYAVGFDEAAEQFSRVRWGLEPQTLVY